MVVITRSKRQRTKSYTGHKYTIVKQWKLHSRALKQEILNLTKIYQNLENIDSDIDLLNNKHEKEMTDDLKSKITMVANVLIAWKLKWNVLSKTGKKLCTDPKTTSQYDKVNKYFDIVNDLIVKLLNIQISFDSFLQKIHLFLQITL